MFDKNLVLKATVASSEQVSQIRYVQSSLLRVYISCSFWCLVPVVWNQVPSHFTSFENYLESSSRSLPHIETQTTVVDRRNLPNHTHLKCLQLRCMLVNWGVLWTLFWIFCTTFSISMYPIFLWSFFVGFHWKVVSEGSSVSHLP